MEIRELKKIKSETENEIKLVLNVFEDTAGTQITEIDFIRAGGIVRVKIKLDL